MSYYVINEETGRILVSCGSEPDPQDEANFYGCSVWIIKGHHSGLTAKPRPPEPLPEAQATGEAKDA